MEDTTKKLGWVAALGLACAGFITLQAWAGRYAMNPDGISYLDMADRLLQGDYGALVHPYWSPLYPCLLAAALKLAPGAAAEFPAAHALNWLIGLGALAAFSFLVREWLRLRPPDSFGSFACRTGLAYMLFLWATVEGVTLTGVTPDLCVAALVYLIAGLCCRLAAGGGRGTACLLGIALGVGCLTKAAMLPLGVALLVILTLPRLSIAPPRPLLLPAALCFAAIAGTYVFALSRAQHRLTTGETGRLNYAWMVQGGVPMNAGWTGEPPGNGTPVHGPRVLSADPAVLEFESPVPGTFPLWYNPAYFHEGLRVRFDWRRQLAALARSPQTLRWAAGSSLIPLLAGLLVIGSFWAAAALVRSPLALWAAAAIGMFAMVTIEARYVAPFLALFWLAAYDAATGAKMTAAQRAAMSVAALSILLLQLSHIGSIAAGARPPDLAVAQGLERLGLRPGDRIATVGPGFRAFYARLARLRIAAGIGWTGGEYADEGEIARLSDAQFERIRELLRPAHIRGIVSRYGCDAHKDGWQPIADTGYCVLPVP